MAASDDTPEKVRLLREANEALNDLRLIGDVVVASFFGREKSKDRETLRAANAGIVELWLKGERSRDDVEDTAAPLGRGDHPVQPFHWEIEFPEVFTPERGGFDAFVGNPPFAGGSSISSRLGYSYLDWLLLIHEKAHGNGDLVAHFFRRAFTLVRAQGALGLIATNKIAQGDTRSTGLRWICTHGGMIYSARKRYKWPGRAAVVISVVHVRRGEMHGPFELDGRSVERITAFLFDRGGHENPATLKANRGKSYLGSKIYGQGFTFDDRDKKGVANPIARMHELIAKDPRNAERIFPYIGGEEVNDNPKHAHHRYVIDFGQMSEEEARRWPDLMAIVEEKVRPERLHLADNPDGKRRKKFWWQFGRYTPALFEAIRPLERVLVIGGSAAMHHMFALIDSRMVFSHKLIVFPFGRNGAFATLQCRVHEEWSARFGTTFGSVDALTYNPTLVFETFPFPPLTDQLETAGKDYYDYRANQMVRTNKGLTGTYNRFHDRDDRQPDIVKLRDLHAAMDRAVLDAYGWSDIPTDCDFFPELDDDVEDDAERASSKKKARYRYRWPDDVRDEVLAQLLELNRQRAEEEEERAAPKAAKKGKPKSKPPVLF